MLRQVMITKRKNDLIMKMNCQKKNSLDKKIDESSGYNKENALALSIDQPK